MPMSPLPRRIWVQVSLVLLPVLAFFPGLSSPRTHYDDSLYLDRPEYLMPGLSGLGSLWAGTSAWNGFFLEYFPLRDTFYWLIFQQWEKSSMPYHVVSLGFHLAATLLVFRFVEKLTDSSWVPAAAALLFAVHPIHIESVVWIAGLKDPMYACFMVGSLSAFLAYRERLKPGLYLLALVLLVCALLTKSMALSTPLIMLAADRWVGRPVAWRTTLLRVAGPGLVCAIFLGQFLVIGKTNSVSNLPHQGSWMAHWVLTAWAQVAYVRQALFPSTFRLIYCFWPVESWADPRLFAGLALVGAVAALVFAWRKKPLHLFALAFYFACLAPVSNLVPFPAVMADRYLYAASVGPCLLIALLLDRARPRLKNTVLGLAVLALTSTTALRSAIWQDEELLWVDADEDPVCIADPEFPAPDVHYLRYITAKDDVTRILALERLLLTRGPDGNSFGLGCEALLSGAQLLEKQGDHTRAMNWAKNAVKNCTRHPKMWGTVLTVTVHRDLPVAASAAQKWFRGEPNFRTQLFTVLTQLELKDEAATRAALLTLVQAQPAETCHTLRVWAAELRPPQRAPLTAALAACAGSP